jgi:hypothetical protein
MRRLGPALAALGLIAVVSPAPAAIAAPKAELMVVGREKVLREATSVRLVRRTVRVDGGRRCAVGARTPLGALAGARLRLRLRDYGSCGRSARDAGGLYVRQVGRDRERGRGGWVYKIGRRTGSGAAGDLAGPFGRGGVRRGARVLWFWCELSSDGCQRTLEVRPSRRRAAPGQLLSVRVRAYDDHGRGIPVPAATVRLGRSGAMTGTDGRVTLTMPGGAGRVRLTASAPGAVRAFPVVVRKR